MRLTLDVLETPPGFPITQIRNVLDYDYINIAGQIFVLPLKASTVSRSGKATLARKDRHSRAGLDGCNAPV